MITTIPPSIDAEAFARARQRCEGEVDAGQLERVAAELFSLEGKLTWSVDGEPWTDPMGRDRPHLHLSARGHLLVPCARCLGPLKQVIAIERWAALAPDESSAEQEDLEAEAYDVLVASPHFSLAQWLEDEVLLELLREPRHADCSLPGHVQDDRTSAFAALESLRKRES